MDRRDRVFIGRGNEDTPACLGFFERVLDLIAKYFHFRLTRRDRVMDEHRNIEITLLECGGNVMQMHPNVGKLICVLSGRNLVRNPAQL